VTKLRHAVLENFDVVIDDFSRRNRHQVLHRTTPE
jgi:hypothetical protein